MYCTCTPVMDQCHVTGDGWISFQKWSSTGWPITRHYCLFVAHLASVAIGYRWISDTKFQKFSDKDWIWICKKFLGLFSESRHGLLGRFHEDSFLSWVPYSLSSQSRSLEIDDVWEIFRTQYLPDSEIYWFIWNFFRISTTWTPVLSK